MRLSRISVLLLFLAGIAVPGLCGDVSYGTSLDEWIAGGAGAPYGSIRAELSELFRIAEQKDIPLELILERLNLGSARKASPSALMNAVSRDIDRYAAFIEVLETNGFIPAGPQRKTALLRGMNAFALGGIPEETIARLFGSAGAAGRDADTVLAAGTTLLKIQRFSPPSPDDLSRIGAALVSSQLPPSSFDSLATFFVKTAAAGIPSAEACVIFVGVLERGGGIIQLEQELSRRMKR